MSRQPGIGPHFNEATKYSREEMHGLTTWAREVPQYKQYEDPLELLALPAAVTEGGPGLWQAVAGRRSVREYAPTALPLQDLSQLLWAAQGVTGQAGNHLLRASASAGALYPNETYLLANRVAGATTGLWHYQTREHTLALLAEGDFGNDLSHACLDQDCCRQAAVVFIWGAVVDRCAFKYGDRAFRYLYMDAGHLGAQVQISAAALGLGSVNVGAFFDDEVNSLLGLDGQRETVVYLTAVGLPL